MKERELLFSVTAKDCEWQFCRGSGKGGQNRNKRDTAVTCIHKSSGAIGKSCDERGQLQNRRLAFQRMAESKKFQLWARVQAYKQITDTRAIEQKIDKELDDPAKTVVEYLQNKKEGG